jgi:hypothetical protein
MFVHKTNSPSFEKSPLQKGNHAKKPLSKHEILKCIIGTELDAPKYKSSAHMRQKQT